MNIYSNATTMSNYSVGGSGAQTKTQMIPQFNPFKVPHTSGVAIVGKANNIATRGVLA